jgi:hypothetical protein
LLAITVDLLRNYRLTLRYREQAHAYKDIHSTRIIAPGSDPVHRSAQFGFIYCLRSIPIVITFLQICLKLMFFAFRASLNGPIVCNSSIFIKK